MEGLKPQTAAQTHREAIGGSLRHRGKHHRFGPSLPRPHRLSLCLDGSAVVDLPVIYCQKFNLPFELAELPKLESGGTEDPMPRRQRRQRARSA